MRCVVGQQLSTNAADAIFGRLRESLGTDFTAPGVAGRTDGQLLEVGLSRAKLASLRGLTERILVAAIEIDRLERLPDDEVRRQLTAVRGIGPWTAELFLLVLGRDDALPSADVGLRRAVRAAYRLDHLPGPAEVEALAETWRPFRSLAACYLYASLHRPSPLV